MTFEYEYKRLKQRRREIEFERIERLREGLDMKDKEIASVMGVSASQYGRYKACTKAPADVFYGLKEGLIAGVLEEARKQIEFINSI